MIDYTSLKEDIEHFFPSIQFEEIKKKIELALDPLKNKKLTFWQDLVKKLPSLEADYVNFQSDAITLNKQPKLQNKQVEMIKDSFIQLHPWRKGPYNIFGMHIDTEWRSDWKWNRIKNSLPKLENCRVLDVGCGNGYHCWRIFGEGAGVVFGIDPYLLSVVQFYAIRHFLAPIPVHVLPLTFEEFPKPSPQFDIIFSMGVIYHRRSPLDHLFRLKSFIIPGGYLILESLVIDGEKGQVLLPDDRYAKMRNVWFIPSVLTLESWLRRCGFKNIHLINVTLTTIEEQRSTEWMTFESLEQFLDPQNDKLTVEGLPAPKRAVFIAENPN
jgi:tRNA (mo5U34)-methyltransferase